MTVAVELVVAMGRNRVIGVDGGMPWHLPADLAHFKRVTMGHTMVMGRRTWESIGRALPGRTTVVISRQPDLATPGAERVDSLQAALTGRSGTVMVVGGGQVYGEALALAQRIYQTVVDVAPDGDTSFPELGPEWREVSREHREADAANPYDMDFLVLERSAANAERPGA